MLDLSAIFDVEDPPLQGHAAVSDENDLPAAWWVLWDERAAIKEFHGGLSREQAEAEALTEIRQQMAISAESAESP